MNATTHLCSLACAVLATIAPPARGQDDHDDHAAPSTRPAAVAHDDHDDHDDHGHDDHGGGHQDEVKLTAEAIRRQNITVEAAAKRPLSPVHVVPGRVAFNGEAIAHVGVAVRGRVTELKVRAGDAVEKGAELLVVESPELGQAQNAFLAARTAVGVAESAVAPARQAFERAQALFEKNQGIALAEVQRREADAKAAEGALATARAAAVAAENNLRLLGMSADEVAMLSATGQLAPRYAVRAPIAGRVVEREVTLGELVSPDKESLLVIADLATVWLLADVPEVQIAGVAPGSRARARLASSNQAVDGAVDYVAPSLDPNTRTGRVRIVLPNPEGTLRPGAFARVEIAAGDAAGEAVVAIPEEAVQRVEGRSVVFVPVEGEANTFAARPVTVGPPVGGFVEVADGLKEGDRFVATGSFVLKADLGKAGAAHEH